MNGSTNQKQTGFSFLGGQQEEKYKSYLLNKSEAKVRSIYLSQTRGSDTLSYSPLISDNTLYTLHRSEAQMRLIVAQSVSCQIPFQDTAVFTYCDQVRATAVYLMTVSTFFQLFCNGCQLYCMGGENIQYNIKTTPKWIK